MIETLVGVLDSAIAGFRVVLLAVAVILAAVCTIDWMVRTRRLSPFGAVARFMRASVDPLLKPVERQVVRAGGLPSSAPWWALAAVIVVGIVLLSLLQFAREEIGFVYGSLMGGPAGVIRLVVTFAFEIMQFALIVRVLHSWIPIRPGAWWWRWAYTITEPILRPLRRLIPPFAMIDITPIIAWFILGLLQGLIVRAI